MAAAKQESRCGVVAIIGPTNAGKSTLVNRLVGGKVAIVTRKIQTTRTRITGIAIHGPAQIIFIDTPGIFSPRRRLDRAMVKAAWQGAADADEIIVLVDSIRGEDRDVRSILKDLSRAKRPASLALNKVDVVKRATLLALSDSLNQKCAFKATYMISALTGNGVDDLMADIAAAVPQGPWLYPGDQLADTTQRLLAAEITREKLYERLHQELPYASAVETETWDEQKDGSVRIGQIIYVERDSQKPIVLGKGGRTVKEIGAAARIELEELFGHRVHLFIFVKVRKDWADDPDHYRAIGLDYTK